MNLHEYQTKRIFLDHGIPTLLGDVAATPSEAKTAADKLGGRVVVKAQVLAGGRGKAGGIKVAANSGEAQQAAASILGMQINGLPVRKVLIDPAAEIEREIYLGITNDRAARKAVMIASAEGGVEIEEVARRNPTKIVRQHINPLYGLRSYEVRDLALSVDLPRPHWETFIRVAQKLWEVYQQNDATLVEINPLVITKDGKLIGLDGKMSIDDNALARHPELEALRDHDVEEATETEAKTHGLSFIKLGGDIGCMVNGAGLAMATMDIIKLYGGEPANFLDIGGGAEAEKVSAALGIILQDPQVKAILINIFGGITRCDEVARGILAALDQIEVRVPMVARLVGTNAQEGRDLLAGAHMITASSLIDAAEKAVAASKGL